MKNVLLVASECVPFIKTGGLADVVGELPKYIDKTRYDVRVILPNYKAIPGNLKEQMKYHTHFYMDLGWRRQYVGILDAEIDGVKFYLVDNEYYFNGEKPYGNIYEDIEKFAFFNRAVLSALPLLDWHPDIIHCNDWQTGLLPVYLKDSFNAGDFYRGIKSIMTIHNLKFQGIWNKKTVMDVAGLDPYYFTSDKLEAYGDANYLKGGIVYADYVTTVSESYAKEIQMPFYGEGLDGLMRARSNCLCGIVNGIDYNEYNPETDKFIKYHFNSSNFRTNKKKNKVLLQEELGLEVNDKKFMLGIVSR
ncbi:MAG: glycogen synthase, partial [Lachnospiraceae bacterium]|nr:glycogen synthase [Lachnospiraceae bacterium]